jgi:hypothetical protein
VQVFARTWGTRSNAEETFLVGLDMVERYAKAGRRAEEMLEIEAVRLYGK